MLCEKPIGMSAAEAASLLEVRARTGVVIGEAFMVNSHPQWIRLRELLREGRIGELRSIVGFFSYFNIDPKNIRNQAKLGGGALMDIGCYMVHGARYAFEQEPTRVVASIDRDPQMQTDRLTLAIPGVCGRASDLYLQHATGALPANELYRDKRTDRTGDSGERADRPSVAAADRLEQRLVWRGRYNGKFPGLRSVHAAGRRLFQGSAGGRRSSSPGRECNRKYGGD